MRKLLLFLLAVPCFADWTTGIGFDFRGTLAYVTDPANTKGVSTEGSYTLVPSHYIFPIDGGFSLGGVTVNAGFWGDATISQVCDNSTCPLAGADRDSTVTDKSLAGINYVNPGNSSFFRVSLPSSGGTWGFKIALGDPTFLQTNNMTIYSATCTTSASSTACSGITSVFTVATNVVSSAGQWVDATGVVRTSVSDWDTNNVEKSLTIPGNTVLFRMGDATNYSVVAYLNIRQLSAPPASKVVHRVTSQ